jgi:hypothetical protein
MQTLLPFCLMSHPSYAQIPSTPAGGMTTQQKPTEPSGDIAGHVYRGDTGEPLFDAIVFLIPQWPIEGRFPEVRTGADGSFDFHSVVPGSYTVEANAEEFQSGSYENHEKSEARSKVISLSAGQQVTGVVIRLDPAGSISGAVYDENGAPARDVMVLAIRPRFESGGRKDVSGGDGRGVDEDGSFRIAGLRPGPYLVRAGGPSGLMADGFRYRETYYPGTDVLENAQTVQVMAGQDTGGIRISVKTEKTYKIIGKIVDPQPSGPRPYEIEVSDPSNIRSPICCNTARASLEKSFTTGGLPPGDYIVSVAATEKGQTPSGWTVTGSGYARVSIHDEDAHVNVVVGNGGEIRGKVFIEGLSRSIPRPRVVLVRTDSPRPTGSSGLMNADGEFEIRDIPPGNYRFAVPVPWGAAYLDKARCLGSDHTIEPLQIDLNEVLTDCELLLRADPGRILGRVLIADRPTPGMVVVLAPEEPELRQLDGYMQTAKSGPDGQFQMSGIIPGKYLVFVTPPLEGDSYYAPEIIDENSSSAQRLSILPRATINMEVTASAAK